MSDTDNVSSREQVAVTTTVSPEVYAAYRQFLPDEDVSVLLNHIMLANAAEVAARGPRTLTPPEIDRVVLRLLIAAALTTDGAQHKQWYLERIAKHLAVKTPDHEPGIAP